MFLLLLEGAMIGVFVSLDLLLFYLFFEASLVPMFFLIGIWGGERRIYAAVKFFIYTAVGSLLMLVGIIALYFIYGTFDYAAILAAMSAQPTLLSSERRVLVVSGFCVCLLHQGAALSVSHLAAGRAHRSADRRFRNSRRRAAEDGNLRLAAFQPRTVSRDVAPVCPDHDHAGGHWNYLRRARGDGPAGRKATGGLFVSQSHGLCRARSLLVY